MLLSICIPTHDGRAETVREAIQSVVDQITPDLIGTVEICISDNGSQDETQEIVQGFADACPGIFVLHRFPENVGGRLNFLKVTEIAGGDWIWMLGSDDVFEPDAIEIGLKAIRSHGEACGICVNRHRMDKTLTSVMTDYRNHHPADPDHEHIYSNADDVICELGLWQNYISGCIFRREYWDDTVQREGVEKITSYRHFTHSYVLACMTVDHPHWVWIPDKIVRYRSDNDAFYAANYTLGRFLAEINDDMRRQFRDTVGTRSRGYRKCMRSMYELWWSPTRLLSWREDPRNSPEDDWYIRTAFTRAGLYTPHFWLHAFPHLLVPKSLLGVHRRLLTNLERAALFASRQMLKVTMAVAPRTRIRAVLRRLNFENGWTMRYDAHVLRGLQLALEYEIANTAQRGFEPRYSNSTDEEKAEEEENAGESGAIPADATINAVDDLPNFRYSEVETGKPAEARDAARSQLETERAGGRSRS